MKRPRVEISMHRLVGLALGVLATSCGPPRGDPRVSHDLVALFPDARVVHETAEVDFGTDAADASIVAGFSSGETAGDGATSAWSEGPESQLRLFLAEPRPLAITFRCWPFVYDGAPTQSVRLSWNGNDLTEIELAPEPGEYRVSVPAKYQVSGENVVRARYRYHREPRAVLAGADDARSVGVAWDWIRVEGAWKRREASARGEKDDGALVIPAGMRVEYFVTAPPESTLVIDAVRSEAPGALTVTTESLSHHEVVRVDSPSGRTDIDLPSAGGIVRLSLQASTEDLLVRRPVVVTTVQRTDVGTLRGSGRRPNIIIYLIDTLRADHLGCYGYSKPTPRIDDPAAAGALFENALAQSSWTKPATASILTGLHPRAHTANEREDALPDAIPTLPEALAEIGYETAALVVNANVSAPFGFDRGFETFELLLHEDGIVGASDEVLIDRAIEWLATRNEIDEPFFLYLHAADPHDPYGTTGFHSEGFGSVRFMESLEEDRIEPTPEELQRLIDLYDEDIASADAQLGRLVHSLEEMELYEDALIILLSDHGEEFNEHGRWRHGKTLYREQLEIPLIIKWPGGEGGADGSHASRSRSTSSRRSSTTSVATRL